MISTTQIIVILVVVLLLFGTKRLRNIGSDLGAAIKGFKKSMGDGESEAAGENKPADTASNPPPQISQQQQPGGRVIDNAAQKQDEHKS
ncbi:MAG: twin-arginine translocase TatA/TatE family subunit [Gammaproteobacteria bacterium]